MIELTINEEKSRKINDEDTDFYHYYKVLSQVWKDAPDVFVSYEHLQYSIPVPERALKVSTLATHFLDMFRSKNIHNLEALAPAEGYIPPGRTVLVLGPPGSGKSNRNVFCDLFRFLIESDFWPL